MKRTTFTIIDQKNNPNELILLDSITINILNKKIKEQIFQGDPIAFVMYFEDDDGDLMKVETEDELNTVLDYVEAEEIENIRLFVYQNGYESILEHPEDENKTSDSNETQNRAPCNLISINEINTISPLSHALSNLTESKFRDFKFDENVIKTIDTGKYPCSKCNLDFSSKSNSNSRKNCKVCEGIGFNEMNEEIIILKRFFDYRMQIVLEKITSVRAISQSQSHKYPDIPDDLSNIEKRTVSMNNLSINNSLFMDFPLDRDKNDNRAKICCEDCEMNPIVTRKYMCTLCDDFFLCQNCYENNECIVDSHLPEHPMVEFHSNSLLNSLNREDPITNSLKPSIISGRRVFENDEYDTGFRGTTYTMAVINDYLEARFVIWNKGLRKFPKHTRLKLINTAPRLGFVDVPIDRINPKAQTELKTLLKFNPDITLLIFRLHSPMTGYFGKELHMSIKIVKSPPQNPQYIVDITTQNKTPIQSNYRMKSFKNNLGLGGLCQGIGSVFG